MNQNVFVIVFIIFIILPLTAATITKMQQISAFLMQTIGFIAYFLNKKQEAGRDPKDNIPIKPVPYTSSRIKKIMQGNYADLGKDTTTGQRHLLSEVDRCKNTVVLGPVGAGKSSWLTATTLAADFRYKGNSVFIFDATNEFIPQAKTLCNERGRELYIYPDIGINPLNLVKKNVGDTNVDDRVRVFSDVLAQVTHPGEDAQYYLRRQQLVLRQVIPLYESVYGQPMILRELWELCLRKEIRDRLIKDAGSNSLAQEYKYTVGAWKDTEFDKNVSGLINFIDTICSGRNKHFYNQRYAPTIEDIIDKKEVCIIREGGDPGTEGHVRGLFFMVALQEATKRREEDSHFLALYIDEFHRYLNPTYTNFIATSRKRRVAQILAFQSLSQLTDSSGKDYSNTIMSNARTCVVHTGLSPEDAEYIALCIGKRQFVYTDVGKNIGKELIGGRNVHENIGYDYAFYPHEIRNLDPKVALILSVKGLGLDAPRLVEKPTPLIIAKSGYRPPDVDAIAPPTVWDERPPIKHVVNKEKEKQGPEPNILLSSKSPYLSEKMKEGLDKEAQEILDKAKKKNDQKGNPNPQNPNQLRRRRPKPQRNQPPKKDGEV